MKLGMKGFSSEHHVRGLWLLWHLHGPSSRGRKVTLAVICRITSLISFWIAFSGFCTGLLECKEDRDIRLTWSAVLLVKRRSSTYYNTILRDLGEEGRLELLQIEPNRHTNVRRSLFFMENTVSQGVPILGDIFVTLDVKLPPLQSLMAVNILDHQHNALDSSCTKPLWKEMTWWTSYGSNAGIQSCTMHPSPTPSLPWSSSPAALKGLEIWFTWKSTLKFTTLPEAFATRTRQIGDEENTTESLLCTFYALTNMSFGVIYGPLVQRYSTVQYSTVQYSTVQYSTVQYSTVQYSTVQYSTVQYYSIL